MGSGREKSRLAGDLELVADGARLDLDVAPGAGRCRSCGQSFALVDLILLCPCGSADVEVVAGRDLKILSMEVS